MKILGVIPARFASSRLPGKPLADLAGKTLIERVYENACKVSSLTKLIVATDDERILDFLKEKKIPCMMTSSLHQSGTDRCAEVLSKEHGTFDFIINIQGDEPFIDPNGLDDVLKTLQPDDEIKTVIQRIDDPSDLFNPNVVKVVIEEKSNKGSCRALYFSRSCIPHLRNHLKEDWHKKHDFYRHIGIYIYRGDVLKPLSQLQPSQLEKAESLEQLRWLSNGFEVSVVKKELSSLGIDTPEDLAKARDFYSSYS